jgi:hypothetical protein
MKKEDKKQEGDLKGDKNISRKEAIKKVGYAAFSAATMMLLLNDPAKANQKTSDSYEGPAKPGNWDDDFGGF